MGLAVFHHDSRAENRGEPFGRILRGIQKYGVDHACRRADLIELQPMSHPLTLGMRAPDGEVSWCHAGRAGGDTDVDHGFRDAALFGLDVK